MFRPDLYHQAMRGRTTPIPTDDCKIEGGLAGEATIAGIGGRVRLGPDRFFDARVFDPDRIDDYLAALAAP